MDTPLISDIEIGELEDTINGYEPLNPGHSRDSSQDQSQPQELKKPRCCALLRQWWAQQISFMQDGAATFSVTSLFITIIPLLVLDDIIFTFTDDHMSSPITIPVIIFVLKLVIDILSLIGLYRHNHYLLIPQLTISIVSTLFLGLCVVFSFISAVATVFTRSLFFFDLIGPLGTKLSFGLADEVMVLGLIIFGVFCIPSIIIFALSYIILSSYAYSWREFKAEKRMLRIAERHIGDFV